MKTHVLRLCLLACLTVVLGNAHAADTAATNIRPDPMDSLRESLDSDVHIVAEDFGIARFHCEDCKRHHEFRVLTVKARNPIPIPVDGLERFNWNRMPDMLVLASPDFPKGTLKVRLRPVQHSSQWYNPAFDRVVTSVASIWATPYVPAPFRRQKMDVLTANPPPTSATVSVR